MKLRCFFVAIIFSLAAVLSGRLIAHEGPPISAVKWPDKITDEMRLGKILFFDTILSADRKTSCSSCHQFDYGGSSAAPRPIQFNGDFTARNSTSIFNLTATYKLGWLANINSPSDQIERLVSGEKVMGIGWLEILARLKADTAYRNRFEQVYQAEITAELVTQAIAAYESALITPSDFDKYLQGDQRAISLAAKQGYTLFKSFGCIACHQGKNIGGNLVQKLGVVKAYPLSDSNTALGRFLLTNRDKDKQVFRVPSLRNVAKTAPYLHDGSIGSLAETIKLMAKHQLGTTINDRDTALIEAFLRTLTGLPHPELMP